MTPIASRTSFWLKTLSILIYFSKNPWTKVTLSAIVFPPLIWISKMLFFFCLKFLRRSSASTFSFLSSLVLALSTSLRIWVIPALNPPKAVKWGALVLSSLGNDLILPLWCLVLFLGRNLRLPFLGNCIFCMT